MHGHASRLGSAMSPTEKPIKASRTLGEETISDPTLERRPSSWMCVRGSEGGRVPNLGRAVLGYVGVTCMCVRHSPSLVVFSRSSIVWTGSRRRECASSSVVVGIRFCHMSMGRWASDPHLGAFTTVGGLSAVMIG